MKNYIMESQTSDPLLLRYAFAGSDEPNPFREKSQVIFYNFFEILYFLLSK